MKALDVVTLVLLIVGGLNWALVGLARFDLVAAITGDSFGQVNALSRVVYVLVGLAALYQISGVVRAAKGQASPAMA